MPVTGGKAEWYTPDSLDTNSNKIHRQIHAVLTTANFGYLQEVALSSRKAQDGSLANSITCTISPAYFTYGMNNLVLRIAFSDDISWIARIQHVPVDPSQARSHAMDMLSEIATMKTVNSRATIPVPQVFAFDVSPTNEFGFSYILMECLKGRVLETTIASSVPAEHLPRVASQLADVLFQLENLTFTQLGRIWCGENCDAPPESFHGIERVSLWPHHATKRRWSGSTNLDRNKIAVLLKDIPKTQSGGLPAGS